MAFREMGLLDEAIGEHQVSRWRCSLIQTYTWLAQYFLDKEIPEGAFAGTNKFSRPNIDEDTRTAVDYEPPAVYESAQNRGEALSHFLQFYGTNIDYRHVVERIKALRS